VQGGQTVEETMSIQDILQVIKGRLLLISTLTIFTVAIAIGLSFYIITPTYQAQTQILVNQNNNEDIYSRTQIDTDLQLINTYNDLITSPIILSKVIENLQLDLTPEQLSAQISLYSKNNSKVLSLEVLDSDPERAVNIANTTAEVFKEAIPALMTVDNINIISTAKFNENISPVSPNKKRNIAIGAVIGIMLGIGLAFLLEILDSTIKDEKDVEDILGIPIMGIVGSIPLEKEKKSSFKSHRVRGSQDVWIEK
jgi:capsular polysaccharide biosynthesis protein